MVAAAAAGHARERGTKNAKTTAIMIIPGVFTVTE